MGGKVVQCRPDTVSRAGGGGHLSELRAQSFETTRPGQIEQQFGGGLPRDALAIDLVGTGSIQGEPLLHEPGRIDRPGPEALRLPFPQHIEGLFDQWFQFGVHRALRIANHRCENQQGGFPIDRQSGRFHPPIAPDLRIALTQPGPQPGHVLAASQSHRLAALVEPLQHLSVFGRGSSPGKTGVPLVLFE